MVEQRGAEKRHIGEARDRRGWEGLHVGQLGRLAEDETVAVEAQAGAQHGHAQARHMLAQSQGDGENTHECAEHQARGGGRGHAQPQAAAEVGYREAAHGAQQHDPFDTEIQYAGAFTEHLTDGGAQQRCGDAQHGGEETCLENLIENDR